MSTVIKKRILTEDDLLKFCQDQKFAKFSSKDTGYQLAVKVPTTFEVDENVDDNHRGMMKLKVKIFHTGLNRNKSYVSKDAAEKAMNTIADRPLLAAIHQLDDGSWDFEGHEMEIVKDENGNEETRYIESQVGSFSSEPAFWEHDDKLDKDFVCAYAYVSEEYTKTCDIIRSKQGSKNSCELFIDDLSYNAKEKYLELNDFYVNASTLLGSRNDGTEIVEGMEGSRADITDFSVKNNSVKFDKDEKIIELLENLNKTLSNFNKDQNVERKEGTIMENKEIFDEEVETGTEAEVEDIVETNVVEEQEVEDSTEENQETIKDEEVENTASEDEVETEVESTEVSTDENSNTVEYSFVINGETKKFAVSLQDKIYAIQDLVNATYAESDNTYYGVTVFEDYVVMCDWWSGRYYKQSYTSENDSYSLTGDRVEVYTEFVTADEQKELESMRANYAVISEKLSKYEEAENIADKMTVFEDPAYANYLESDEFKNLMSEDTVKKFTKDELAEKADAALGKLVKTTKNFSFSEADVKPVQKKNKVSVFSDFDTAENQDVYGDYFKSLN